MNKNLDIDIFGERFRRGVTQKELANAIARSKDTVRAWEEGESAPDLNDKIAILEFLNSKPVLRVASWSVKELVRRINKVCRDRKLTMGGVANQIGISYFDLRRFITGRSTPSPHVYCRMEAFFFPNKTKSRDGG